MDKLHLIDHLLELRQRLLYSFAAFFIAFCISYPFASNLFEFLVQPLATLLAHDPSRRLIYTGLTEAFLTYLKLSFLSALILSLPVLAFNLWKFMAPGLYAKEKKAFLGFVAASPLLFVLGAAMAYYVVCPMAWSFFLSFEVAGTSSTLPVQLEARVSEYLALVTKLLLSFGLCFQLPLILYMSARMGLITRQTLKNNRKYAFLIIVIIAAIITPPDLISPISLIIPIYALYEASIWLIKEEGEQQRDLST